LKKNAVLIIAILSIVILLSGCAASVPNPTPTPTPTATLTVYSSCFDCWGYIWVNGFSTGKYIDYNGSVTVSGLTPGTVASVQIVDEYGNHSHTEYVNLAPGNNILNFTWFW
jgi:hypothetical protein